MAYLDKDKEVKWSLSGHLPHADQDNVYQFITFRLADSLPQAAIKHLKAIRERFCEEHPFPWDLSIKKKFEKMIGPVRMKLLDNGYGSCILKNEWARKILLEIIEYKNDVDYKLLAIVIMPNHVHMLLETIGANQVKDIMKRIKGRSGREINKKLGQTGEFWCRESYDRMIRSEEHLRYCINYIRENPIHLQAGDYYLFY